MDIHQIINLFKEKTYKVKDISTLDGEWAYSIEDDILTIGIFDYDYPDTGYNGKICVDFSSQFDKWSKCFYQCDFPSEEDQFNMLLSDLDYLKKEKLNEMCSNKFGKLVRTF
jgi:hypothetical protein